MARPTSSIAYYLACELYRRAQELDPEETDLTYLRSFRNDPNGFARKVLGVKLWSRQREIVEAVSRHRRVSVASGHKCGKSTALAVLAIWFYCTFPESRVVITATSDRQVNGIIWREIKRLIRNCKYEIPGAEDISIRAQTGITSPIDASEIRGYTASEAEAIAGISGPAILYLVDEASGVKDFIFEAIEGNRAGGNAWVFLISNPTRAEGEFYESHHAKAWDPATNPSGYFAIHIDSRESPNVTGEWRELWDKPLAGLATPEWVEEKLRDWGEDNPLFLVRVAGSFSVAEAAKIFQLALIETLHEDWDKAKPTGRLVIGVDPSGDGDQGDEGGFCARRGFKVLEFRAKAGMPPAEYIIQINDLIKTHDGGIGLPLINIESEGEDGWKVFTAIREYAEEFGTFEVYRIRTSDAALREKRIYDRRRDELFGNARAWIRDGGKAPDNSKLDKDLHAPEFIQAVDGKVKVTPKKELRKMLGRSPDIGDAFLISCWEPLSMRVADAEAEEEARKAAGPQHSDALEAIAFFDPYSGMGAWNG
jgi:phage terminase large subunit